MTGLEKILKAIEDDAQASADAAISEAKIEAEEILNAAKAEAEKRCSEIVMKSEIEIKAVLSRAESAAALQERKYILDAKQQIINDTISKARSTLINLPVLEYFDVIYRMIRKYAQNKQGNILFSANDKKRLPVDFNAKLQEALSGKKQASLMVADQEAVIDGGFILVYGEVEENCSFDALFSSAKEDLQDKVNAFLFD